MPTYRDKFIKFYNLDRNEPYDLNDIARITGIPKKILQEVYNRGVGAWKTNIASVRLKKDFSKNTNLAKYPRSSRLSKEQWAYARVYSFVMYGTTAQTADADLVAKILEKHIRN